MSVQFQNNFFGNCFFSFYCGVMCRRFQNMMMAARNIFYCFEVAVIIISFIYEFIRTKLKHIKRIYFR